MVQEIKKRIYTGQPKKLFEEKKVYVYAYVKRKYSKEFQELVTELAKQYR